MKKGKTLKVNAKKKNLNVLNCTVQLFAELHCTIICISSKNAAKKTEEIQTQGKNMQDMRKTKGKTCMHGFNILSRTHNI